MINKYLGKGMDMTERESEIFEWIKENPLISQQEIADRAGITRSSVAVHISNLMKKGMIKGKGYVLSEQNYITVVGAVNVDISGTPGEALRMSDSNPGKMNISFGGVGRNIAENLARLGANVSLITALGDDFYEEEIEKHLRGLQIDVSHSLRVKDQATSTYLCINNAEGDMAVAISDMDIYEKLTPEFLDAKINFINRGMLLVIDGNIPKESIDHLLKKVTVPVVAEPVSIAKAMRFADSLDKITYFKPNRFELGALTGVDVDSDAGLKKAAETLINRGVENLIVSLGEEGIFIANKEKSEKLPAFACKEVNTTGCGDSLIAALAFAASEGKNLKEAAEYGLAAASICIEHDGAISPDMLLDNILYRIKNNK